MQRHVRLVGVCIAAGAVAMFATLGLSAGASELASRQAYFGELHLHTGYSFDAFVVSGVRTTPEEAYRYAEGLPVDYLGRTVQRPRPLDFAAVTDHAEFLGVLMTLDNPQSALSKSEWASMLREQPKEGLRALGMKSPLLNDRAAMDSAWKREIEIANRHYQPGKFTTFVAYEWTSMPDGKSNLHRNVIFQDGAPAAPFTANDSQRPEDLWSYLERLRAQGVEALAIPHNANASGGLMFDWNDSDGHPISESYAQRRAYNEPLTEVFQNKGQSETAPELSPNDEFANFEVMRFLLVGGIGPVNGGGYARQALGRGQVIASKVGANPFKLGFVGGSDFHNGLSNADENAYAGRIELSNPPGADLPNREFVQDVFDPTFTKPGSRGGGGIPIALYGSGGLTGVWAEANTRESIYAALRRKETFATSGPMLQLRFFAGWKVNANALSQSDWVSTAYATATPMGGDLPALPLGATAPGFIVQAVKDPESGNLDRIQIIKVWLEGDDYREKVFDVVWSSGRKPDRKSGRVPAIRNTVDLKTATYVNSVGASTLSGVWHDPEFDARKPAVYYARAIEIPTPRWNTILAVKTDLPLPDHMSATIQERAISSPIWYTPRQ